MKKKDFKKITIDQAKKNLEKNKKDLFNLRFQKSSGQLDKTARISQVRKQIARVKTAITSKMKGKK